jgi:uncharacterized membrane protein
MTVAQLLLKKGMLLAGQFPQNFSGLIPFFLRAFTNTYVISAVFVTILTALAWILVLSKEALSHVYPFMALSFVLTAFFSILFFKENITLLGWVGVVLVCLGAFLVLRG